MRQRSWIPIQVALRDDLVAETLVEDAAQQGQPLSPLLLDIELEGETGAVSAEIERRRDMLGPHYPFTYDAQRQALLHRGSATLAYEFCLALTQAPSLSDGALAELPRAFERLTGRVVQAFLGDGAQWMRTGFPPAGDRPSTFRETMRCLNSRTGEWAWRPFEDRPEPDPKSVKDGGLDLVVWKYPEDGRAGGITLVGQCACGNDWPQKTLDLSFDRLAPWIPRPTVGREVRFFALPFHIADKNDWIDRSFEASIIFDRVRIAMLSERCLASANLPATLEPLIARVFPDFRSRDDSPAAA